MARQYLNLAQVYGAVDNAKANQAQLEAQQMQQENMRYQQQRQMNQDALQDRKRGIYSGAIETDDTGAPRLNEKRLIAELLGVAPEEALAVQSSFSKRDSDAAKMNRENVQAELAEMAERTKQARDIAASVYDDASFEQAKPLLAKIAPQMPLPDRFDAKWRDNITLTADGRLKQIESQLGRDVTMRGQDITLRGQDLSASTARRGQDITMRGQNMTDSRAQDKAANPPKTQLSSSAQKELFEADEMVQASKNALGMLGEAKALNRTAYSGFGAKPRAIVASNLGLGGQGADDTVNLDNLMTGQALESLKATFGGMPTEGERKILLDIQASADKTPSQRAAILDRAEAAAKRRISFNENKAKSLREGTYFTEGAPMPQEQPAARPQANPSQLAAPKIGTVKGGYVFKGGNPADPKSWKAK